MCGTVHHSKRDSASLDRVAEHVVFDRNGLDRVAEHVVSHRSGLIDSHHLRRGGLHLVLLDLDLAGLLCPHAEVGLAAGLVNQQVVQPRLEARRLDELGALAPARMHERVAPLRRGSRSSTAALADQPRAVVELGHHIILVRVRVSGQGQG
eukprot:scaffold6310_cov67-Phaeocystis_antarctica.AAC.4